MKQSHKTLLLWVLLIMIFLGIWTLLSPDRPPATKVNYTDFLAMVEANRDKEPYVERVTVKEGDYIFTVKDPQAGTTTKKLAEGPREVSAEVRVWKPVSFVSFGSASGVTRCAIAAENRSLAG